jgi:hypothetical protein
MATPSLIIEDGSGVAGADSFITAAEMDALADKLFALPDGASLAVKEAALRRAFLFMKGLRWRDEFPTFDGTIPDDVKKAQGILGHYEKDSPNGLSPNVVPGQQKVLNRVGEIGWQVTGQTGVNAQRAVVTLAMDLLKPYLMPQTSFLLRA